MEQNNREQGQPETAAPEVIPVSLTLTNHDIQNIVAFGNRAHMTGQEADTWVDLKIRLSMAVEQAEHGDAGLMLPPDIPPANPGGTG